MLDFFKKNGCFGDHIRMFQKIGYNHQKPKDHG